MFTAINPFSRGQPQPPPPTQLQTQKAISDQVRQEWHEFESAWFKPQQSTMERRCAEKFKELDKAFRASTAAATTPVASSSKSKKRSTNNNTNTTNNSAAAKAAAKEHESKKVQVREELRKELVLKAREEWQRRLTGKGLRDDDWADMSVDEQEAVERALGGDFEEDDEDDSEQEMTFSQMQAPMMSTAAVGTSLFPSLSSLPSQPAASSLAAVAGPSSNPRTTLPSLQTLQTNVAPAPSLSSATRSTNASTASSSYAFVNPSSLGKPARSTQPEVDDDDDDETSPFEDIGYVYDAVKRKSDYRDAYDTPTGSSSFSGTNSGWSTDLSLSTHTSHTSSPEQPAPRTIPPMDKDGSMPGSWFAPAKEKDVSVTPTTATVKGSKSGWGISSKSNGKGTTPAQPATSTSTIPPSSTSSTNNNASSSSTRARSSGPYIGPDLNTTDDFPFTSSASTSHNTDNSTLLTSNTSSSSSSSSHPPSSSSTSALSSEEADFENYKMDVRIAKIREFHEEAAAADEYLIREIFRARKLWKLGCYDEEIDMGSDEGRDIEKGSMEYTDILRKRREKKCWEVECRRIEEHERTMVNLRKLKEDERRGIVEMERKRRREAIRGQQQQQQQRGSVVGQQQQRREREAREREAKEEAAREREREIMMKEKEMREREIAWMGSKATSGHGSSTSLFAPPSQISLEHSASSFASAFNNTSVSTSLFTPTPATTMVDPFSASFHQQSQPSFNATNASTKAPTISLFPEEEEYAIDEAKIASMLASQMQMAQKFDGWSSGSGGSKGGSPRSLGEGGTPLPATTTTSFTGNETKGTGSSTMSAKVELKAAPLADNSKKGEPEKVKEEKGPVKKGPSSLTPAVGKAAPTPAPAIVATSSSESEPKSEPVKVVPATGKNAKKKGKKGQAAVPVPAPAPAPAPTPVKETAKAPAKVEATKTPAKVETTTNAKGKTASPPVKEVPNIPTKSGKVETKTPAKKDDTPISTTSSSISNATSSGPTTKVSSIWGKKEEPAVAKAKKEETTSVPPTSISQPTKTGPTPTRWKVSLFDDEPTPAPVPAPSKPTMDSMTSSSTSSAFAAKHGLQPPSAQSFWHPPGTNSGVARSTSDQPGGGLKAPEPSSVARAASDQPVNKMSSSSSSSMAAQQKSVPERWLPPQAKQQQQQPSVAQPQPQPWDRKPTNASFARTRRMSEPAPPSPVDPAFFAEAAKASNGRSAEVKDSKNTPTSTTSKATSKANGSARGKASRKTAVVVEDASDDEEDQDGVGEALALDSRYIMEENPGIVRPKPSVAGKMFNNIFDYEEDDSGSSTTEVPSSFAAGGEGMMMKDAPSWDTLAKSTKAKHVRWTPSTLGNSSPISFGGDEETASVNIESFLQTATSTLASSGMPTHAPPGGRGRTSSVSHASGGFKGWGQTVPASAFGGGMGMGMGGGAVADMDVMGKGKGVDRGSFSKQDASEEMGWYTKGAMESLKQMRSKPASAV